MKAGHSLLVLLALSAALVSVPVVASDALEITEWTVPWAQTRPRDPWVQAPDRIWFVGQRGDYVARLDPTDGEFERYDLEPGAGPHTVIVNDRGVWYAGNRAAHIGRIDPAGGEVEQLMLPGEGRRDVHTMDFTAGGDIWFTVQHGNQIGFLETGSGEIILYPVATSGARPYGLIVDGNDQPWVVLFGASKLATVVDGEVREIELPRAQTHPRRLAVTDDGKVWYVDFAGGYIGRYDPATEAVDEWRAPAAADSRPYAMAGDAEGRLWFVETGVQPNRFVGFDPATESFTEPVEIPSGGGTVRHMVFDAGPTVCGSAPTPTPLGGPKCASVGLPAAASARPRSRRCASCSKLCGADHQLARAAALLSGPLTHVAKTPGRIAVAGYWSALAYRTVAVCCAAKASLTRVAEYWRWACSGGFC